MLTLFQSKSGILPALLLLTLAFCVGSAFADPPSRVARLSLVRGDVSFSPAGEDNWHTANLNRPLVRGDKLYTDRDARAELDLGAVTVRLDERSSFSILELDDSTAQIELTEGTLNLHVQKLYGDQRYEVDTPTLAFVISQPGEYRIDIAAQGNGTRVTVFDGAGDVFGEAGTRYRIDERQSYSFNDSRLRDVAVQDLPRPDDFDNWCFARDERYDNSQSRRYVSDEVIGGADLDEYGDWDDTSSYGAMWYPARVDAGWAPYRSGHWAWIDPWGWTWVDNEPWGFAPFHYGRWVYVGDRWGWLPGPVALRPVYAPALVVFVGGSNWQVGYSQGGAPVGWCPLGPRDVYVPPYSVSRDYFTHVNASNGRVIDRDRIGSSYEAYAHHRPVRDRDYAYRNTPAAVTAVSHDTFVHARPVGEGRLHLKEGQLARAEIANDLAPSPTAASLMPAGDSRHSSIPRESFHRGVITQNAPPPSTAPFAARLRAIERNGGRPLAEQGSHQLDTRHSAESRDTARQQVPATMNTETGSESASQSVVPRDRSRSENTERARDLRAVPPDTVVPQAQEAPRTGRRPHEERALPSTRFAPSRELGRDTRQAPVERAMESRQANPAEPPITAGDSPVSQPAENARTDERHPPPARDFARQRSREAPAQVEQRNVAPAPIEDNSNRRVERSTRRNQRDQAPQAIPVQPAPQAVPPQAPENTAPPAPQPTPRNQRPAPQAPEAGRGRMEQHRNRKQDVEDGSGQPDASYR